jgi:hypothetical protein
MSDLLQSKKGLHLAPVGEVVVHERSKLFTTNDRYMREEQLMVHYHNFKLHIVTFEIRWWSFRYN